MTPWPRRETSIRESTPKGEASDSQSPALLVPSLDRASFAALRLAPAILTEIRYDFQRMREQVFCLNTFIRSGILEHPDAPRCKM